MTISTQIHKSFEAFAKLHPLHPAIFTDQGFLTYAELNSIADQLALALLKRDLGIQEAVGVLTERSSDLPAAFLAILKAGGVYVPMVADLPADRLANIARQAGIKTVIALDGINLPSSLVTALTENGQGRPWKSSRVIRPEKISKDENPEESLALSLKKTGKMTDLAAILFTSGSTGIPKGVMLQHDACANMALGHIQAHGIHSNDRILLSTSPGFILGFRELCLPFMSGAAFVPVSRSIINNPDLLRAKMERHCVSLAMFTPSYLRLFNGVVPRGLRCIITAGERPNAADARHWAHHLDYWNVHGATEVCGTICMHRVDPLGQGGIPSGKPFANTNVYLLDENGNEVKNGVGEIHIVGIGVARGYLNQPELSDKTFIKTRYGRAYRSRDLARWNENGELETMGRADDVIKISGQSVCLGEIESALQSHPDARRATVLQHRGKLIGCVECPDSQKRGKIDWREFLGKTLPSYMIPAQITQVSGMPISSAGKLDRKSLINIIADLDNEPRQKTAPQGKLELTIAGVWENIIDIRPVSREDNFFTLGGTSLMAIAVSTQLHRLGFDVPVQMLLTALTIKKLAAQIIAIQQEDAGSNPTPKFKKIATADQENFWIASKIGLAPAASHIGRVLSIHGGFPPRDRWQSAWTRLLDHHAGLRTRFYSGVKDTSLTWETAGPGELSKHKNLIFDSCSSLAEAQKIVSHWRNKEFNLGQPPLARAGLITVDDENQTLFWFVFHHCVVDGISARLIQDDLLALLGNRQLPPAPNGVAIACRAEQKYLDSERVGHDQKFWLNRLESLIQRDRGAFNDPIVDLKRPALPTGRGSEPLVEHLDADTVQKLGHLAKCYGTGFHGLLLAILTAETRRRTGSDDVIIGSGISVRPAGCETVVGHFVNLLPVILIQDEEQPFCADLCAAQSALTETIKHSAYPAARLYREFQHQHPELRPSRTSVFDIALTAVPPRTGTDTQTQMALAPQPLPGELEHPAAGLDLLFSHEPCFDAAMGNDGINIHLSWNPDVCSKTSAAAWISSVADWARRLAKKPECVEQPFPALLGHEIQLLDHWETGPIHPCQKKFCHQVFEDFAVQYPRRPAVVSRERVETYAQLNTRADKIGRTLRCLGVVRGTRVGVLTIGSSDLAATILGIWKAGGIYLPLAHELPEVRLTAMSKDADAKLLVVLDKLEVPKTLAQSITTRIRFEDCLTTDRVFDTEVHSLQEKSPDPNPIAYIIYTSGTTGMPKGVPVTHDGYINCIRGMAERVGLLPDDRMAMASTVGFDASLLELGLGLLNGICLVPVHMLRDDPWQLKRTYHELGVTIAFHTPSYLRISEHLPFKGLRILLTGGEAPNHHDARVHAGHLDFWNCYGPTETAIVASLEHITDKPDQTAPLSVGRPLPNVSMSLRRADGSRVPPGVQGEVWIGGIGVAHDYLNRPELNAKSFITLPEGRFYRTGDYGSWTGEGKIVIHGRIDHQVKLNGQRVELGEIEQMLCTHPDVSDAIVVVENPGSGVKVLRAFIRATDLEPNAPALSETKLTNFLAQRLPAHMRPAGITKITTIPLTPAGKIDRSALLKLERVKQTFKNDSGQAPRGKIEKRIAAIWADVLGVRITRNDNFFALGGNSLIAVTLAHRISEELNRHITARSIFAAPTFAGFANRIKSATHREKPLKIDTKTNHASQGEKEFWIAETMGLYTTRFTIPVHCPVMGNAEHDSWQKAWSTLVARHEGLRTFFKQDENGQLIRKIASRVTGRMAFTRMQSKTDALAHIRRCQKKALPMGLAPLWRAGLVEIKNAETHQESGYFWLALHHSIGDGQSINTILNELTILLGNGILPPAEKGARVLAAREKSYLDSKDAANDARYWTDMLKTIPDRAFEEWPLDKARSPLTQPGNHRLEIGFDSHTGQKLKTLAKDHNATLHSLMLTLFAMEVRRRTGRSDILIGTTASIRESASDAQIVGYGVNMLPLHLILSEHNSFSDMLKGAKDTLARALQHARYPFSLVCRNFWNERPKLRHPQRYPLFDIAITENPGRKNLRTGKKIPRRFIQTSRVGKKLDYERTQVSPGQDMVLIHESIDSGEFLLKLHVNAAVYTAQTAQNWIESLAGWIRRITHDTFCAAYPLPRLLPEEQTLLGELEYGKRIRRPKLRYHELFETVVDRREQADRPAVVTQNGAISYKALDEKANAIAHALVNRGVSHGDIIAVLSGRSPQLPAAALGIWKAGAVYLPLAFDLPPERLAFIARDAGISHIMALDGASVPELLAHGRPKAIRPEELSKKFCREHRQRIIRLDPPEACSSDTQKDVAYILYTSGSTGQPKGTVISHKSYVNLVLGAVEIYGLSNFDRCLMFASPCFDVSLSDIGVPLACGAAIYPVPYKTIASPNRFFNFLKDMSITVADITPTYLRLFQGRKLPSSLRILVTGGEPPVVEDAQGYAGQLSYYNAYGPTENTITSCMGMIKNSKTDFLCAGRPLPNTSIHICDSHGNPLPFGVVGEIWLGGAGLAMGYLNRPELMQEAFVTLPQGRRYRTGDLGRWTRDKTVKIEGRNDDQVKLNGIRIELGEIEHALAGHGAVSQAVCLLAVQDDGKKSLWGFIRPVQGEKNPSDEKWRAYLSKKLPAHMIPSGVIGVSAIPLSTSGKVDRSALSRLLPKNAAAPALTLPQNDLERTVAQAWAAVLKITPIHREDNFFSLGGHSLSAIEAAYRLEKKLGRDVPARELFIAPSLAGFAERLRAISTKDQMPDHVSDRATTGQQEFWTAQKAQFDTGGFNISLTLGVQGNIFSPECWLAAWDKLVLRHDALRTGFAEDDSGVLRRKVSTQLKTKFKIETASSLAEAKACITARQSPPFSMEVPGLWRAGLTRITDSGRSIFWFVIHHAVGDGLSLGILIDELAALLQNRSLPACADTFDRVAASERHYLSGKNAQTDALYWQTRLADLGNAFDEWPLDRPRSQVRTSSTIKGSHSFCTHLDPVAANGLRALARKNGATVHALMLTIVGLEVSRRTGRSRFLLGTAASTRKSAAEAGIVGYFVNMLPLVFSGGDDESIHSALGAMQKELAQALQHSGYPFARIYDDFRRQHANPSHPGRYPLFDIAVTENPAWVTPKTGFHFTGLARREHSSYELRHNAPAQDMVLVHEEQPNKGLALTWYVNAAIYEKQTAQAWFNSLIGWVAYFGRTLQTKDTRIPPLLPGEKRLLNNWQKGPVLPLPVASFPDLFRQLAQAHPQNPGIITDGGVRSYTQINTDSDALANTLLKQNLKRGDAVGVFTQRSAALPGTTLAIWKAGGCYLPLTSDLPAERLCFMAKDAGIKILIVLDGLVLPPELDKKNYTIIRPDKRPKTGKSIALKHGPTAARISITPDDLAYIIYTSGSTGLPKGVVLNHGAMLNLGLGQVKKLGINAHDRILLMASPSFDLWISDLVMAWAAAGALVPVRREQMDDIGSMHTMFKRLGVSVATMSPSYLRLFEQANLASVRILMTVGEPPVVKDLKYYSTRLAYYNGYGPTENTAAATLGRVQNARQITAGNPIINTEVCIVNDTGNPTPPGVIGEIWLSGIGLAVGYLNRPDLTQKAFVKNRDKRYYRTGDLGRWLPNGDLQIIGRMDSQVKLRGQRVEPEEIEHWLSSYPGVVQAVVILDKLPDSTQVLRAFFTMEQTVIQPTRTDLNIFLSARLPAYMIPSTLVRVDSIPLTAAGKVNSQLLLTLTTDISQPIPMASGEKTNPLRTPPQNAIEKKIALVWAEQIGCPIAREDNFFELGGDSLRAIAVVGQLGREFKCKVNALYENPILADFAAECQPRPDHLRTIINDFCAEHQNSCGGHSEAEIKTREKIEQTLDRQRKRYKNKICSDLKRDLKIRHNYRQVLLTGATGYLGSYLLHELMADPALKVTLVVRGNDNESAGARVGQVLSHYFGAAVAKALCEDRRLSVLAGDLRSSQLGLSAQAFKKLVAGVDAIYHCAANVNHIGHYGDFHADNVTATRHLLSMAALRKPEPADFHFISSLSVSNGMPAQTGQLFTEYDTAPRKLNDNYYIRTKQEAEHLVICARNQLANACIHRIGNITFANRSSCLQQNIEHNAFFRQLVSFIRLGAVPVEIPASLSHVDRVASAVIALGGTKTLVNEIHHIETARRDRLADFIRSDNALAKRVIACDFGSFLERLKKAVDEPGMESAVTQTVETFGLESGRSVFSHPQRICVASNRTQALLVKLGLSWPEIDLSGQNAMLKKAIETSEKSVRESVEPNEANSGQGDMTGKNK